MSTAGRDRLLRFGSFELSRSRRELRRCGHRLHLPPQAFDVLVALTDRPGDVVTRQTLIDRLWGQDEVFVDYDGGINSAIKRLRRTLRDDARSPRFIETVPKSGYRFVAPVEVIDPPSERRATTLPSAAVAWIAASAIVLLILGTVRSGLDRPSAPGTTFAQPPEHAVGVEHAGPQAIDAFDKARYLARDDDLEALERSLPHFRRAIALAPDFAPAYAGLAYAQMRLRFLDVRPRSRTWQPVIETARRALDLDPDLVDARLARGFGYLFGEWDFTAAFHDFSHAVVRAPEHGEAHAALAAYFAASGDHDLAIEHARTARDLAPERLAIRADLCWFLLYGGRFAEAETSCRRNLELEPADAASKAGLAEALRGQDANAAAAEQIAARFGLDVADSTVRDGDLTALWALVRAGIDDETLAAYPYFAATACALAGWQTDALAWLERAVELRSPALLFARSDPRLASLAAAPAFDRILGPIPFPARRPSPSPSVRSLATL